jgi:alpha-tubulin suppressor-like RCC1 family protein
MKTSASGIFACFSMLALESCGARIETHALFVKSVSAGGFHTCSVTASGHVECWGSSKYGQLGSRGGYIPPFRWSSTAVLVSDLNDSAVSVASGENHTCALASNGSVKCWGYNADGELGARAGFIFGVTTPITVRDLGQRAVSLYAGAFHSCALLANGDLKCWGKSNVGQLGNNQSGFFQAGGIGVASAAEFTTSNRPDFARTVPLVCV